MKNIFHKFKNLEWSDEDILVVGIAAIILIIVMSIGIV